MPALVAHFTLYPSSMPVDHYENFPVASVLLPKRLRPAVEALYAFARGADDIADEGDAGPAQRLQELAQWREQLDCIAAGQIPTHPVFMRLLPYIARHQLPLAAFYDLLSAFAQDVHTTRYADYPTLLDYCARSANPVGRLMLHLYEAATADNLARSDAICSALQIINFWQDVEVDWRKQRIYLPLEDLARFGVTESMLANQDCGPAWQTLMAFEVQRARALMLQGADLALHLRGRIGWELRLVVQGGLAILEKIEAVQYDVFRRRPVLGKADYLRLVWRALWMRPANPAGAV